MSTIENEPFIPDEILEAMWLNDSHLQEAHQELASQSLDRFWGSMPLANKPFSDESASFVDLRHPDDPGTKHAIVLPLPYANGWAPHMAYRAKLLQNSLDTPHRIIVFPNNTAFDTAYSFTEEENATVADGDFSPLASKQFNVLDELGIESIQYIGYSQGATVGAVALKLATISGYFDAQASGLIEAPNMSKRTVKELSKAFTAGGVKPLNTAINDSAIPGLSESQRSRGGSDAPKQLAGFALFGLGTKRSANRAIKNGFTHDRFYEDVSEIADHVPVLVGAAVDSKIADPVKVAVKSDLLVEGYGHEMGDNIVVHTLLAKLALTAA